MRLRTSLMATLLIGGLSGCADPELGTDEAAATKGPVPLTFLNVSDWHAQLDPLPNPVAGRPAIGGAPAISAYWQQERIANPNAFTFTAGDAFGASPPLSKYFGDEPAVLALGLMGIDADTFGNHSFDAGLGYLQHLIDLASYKFVVSNLDNLEGNLEGVHKRKTFMVGGVKIGVVGILNEDAATLVRPGRLGTLSIADSAAAAMDAADQLRRSGAKVVIAIVHKGVEGFEAGAPVGPLIDFANAVTGFDVIFGDHTDVQYAGIVHDQWVVENRSKGLGYARTNLTVNGDGTVTPPATTFVTPLINGVTPDQAIVDLLAPYRAQLAGIFGTVIATSTESIFRKDACGTANGRRCESKLGNVTTDALRLTYGTEFAITNSGGLRDALTCPVTDIATDFCPAYVAPAPPPFTITRGSVNTVLPFGNEVVTVTVNGAELKRMLENGVSRMPLVDGRFPQVSGLCFTYRISNAAGSRVTGAVRQAADGTCTGAAIDLTAASSYLIAENDFMADGGDGYPVLMPRATTRDLMDQVLADHVAANSPISAPIQGRITCTTAGLPACPVVIP